MQVQAEQSGDKLVFAGPVGVGKTTAIACLSEIPPVSTDVKATDETLQKKENTTVAMDYGFMTLEDGQYLHLYGTPGQSRFDFMWDILTEGSIGLILLVDATSDDPAGDLDYYLDRFDNFVKRTGAVIGISRSDLTERNVFDELNERLVKRNQPLPIFEIDAREAEDVKILVHALLAVLESG